MIEFRLFGWVCSDFSTIKENSNLKSIILAKYTSWQIEVKDLGKLNDAEQQLVTKQEKVWKMLGAGEDVARETNISSLIAKWNNLTIAEAKSLFLQLYKTELEGSKIVRKQTEILEDIAQRGIKNPYNLSFPIEDITLSKDAYFVRAYNENITGRWMIAIDDVENFTSVDDYIEKTAMPIIDEFGNIKKPNEMVLIKIQSGTTIRKSIAGSQDWKGQGHLLGGATQYEIVNFNIKTMKGWFKNMGSINDFIK